MRWRDLALFHWRVPVEAIRPLVPPSLQVDTFDGQAWVGLVPFSMPLVRVYGCPRVPGAHAFHECNVRTYVSAGGEPGVWFFSLDAASRLAVWGARLSFGLPYFTARIGLQRQGERIDYAVRRGGAPHARLDCAWEAGEPLPRTRPGELAHFLTDRLCLYTVDRRGRPWRGRIWHQPWSLRTARVGRLDDGLVGAAGIAVDQDLRRNPPLAHHADELFVEAWPPERA